MNEAYVTTIQILQNLFSTFNLKGKWYADLLDLETQIKMFSAIILGIDESTWNIMWNFILLTEKNIYCFYIFKIHCKFINLFPGTAGFLNGEIKDTWLKISHSVEKWQQISVNLTKFLQCLSCWMQGRPYTRLRSLEPGHLGLRWGEASSCKVWWTLKWPSSSCFKQCLEIYWSVGVNWCADSIGKWL